MSKDRVNLHTETWSWMLDEIPEGLFLSVVCGTVGLYERSLLLEPSEIDAWRNGGPAALEPLVEAIRNDVTGAQFGDRYRPDLADAGTDDG